MAISLGKVFEPFVAQRPICVMARDVLENLFNAERIDALFGIPLGHLHGGLHGHDRSGRLVNDIADPVVAALGAADLAALHKHHAFDRRGGRKAVHDLAQIRRAIGTPRTRFRRCLRRQCSVPIGPLGYRQ